MARFLLRYKLKAISLAAEEAELATGDIVLLSGLQCLQIASPSWDLGSASSCRGIASNCLTDAITILHKHAALKENGHKDDVHQNNHAA